jgi:hypothetical protein
MITTAPYKEIRTGYVVGGSSWPEEFSVAPGVGMWDQAILGLFHGQSRARIHWLASFERTLVSLGFSVV